MIEEASLYANLHVETSPVASTASWTDHIATVRDVSLSRGGYEPFIGVSQVEVGSGTITLIDNTATINPGYWVRVRYDSDNVWAGFVQDVNTTYTFIDGVQYALKTLVVLDWVGWISQYSFNEYAAVGTNWSDRARNINLQIDPSGANKPITESLLPPATSWTYPKYVGPAPVSEILDLLANSIMPEGYWMANTNSPAGSSSGLDNLIILANTSQGTVSGTFTDGSHTGTPTNLVYYNDIEMVQQTSSVVNNVVVENIFENSGNMLSSDYTRSDSTSIATYGSRLATINTSVTDTQAVNMFPYPSFEDLQAEGDTTNFFYSIEQPAKDSTGAWSAYDGSLAYRAYNKTGAGTAVAISYDHRMTVNAGTTYYGIGYAATSATPNTRARYRVQWYDDANAIIATSYGSYVSLSSFKTWYKTTISIAAPANTTYARIGISYDRSTGAAFAATSKQWADGMYFGTTNVTDWFDGDTADTSTYLYDWYGTPNASPSYRMTNHLYTIAGDFLTDNKTAHYSPITIRMNAQARLATATSVDLYKEATIWQGAHRWTSIVTGLNHNIAINPDGTTRWMIDIIVRPSTYTI